MTSLQEPVELSNSVDTVDTETRDHSSLYSLCVDLTSLDVLLQGGFGGNKDAFLSGNENISYQMIQSRGTPIFLSTCW